MSPQKWSEPHGPRTQQRSAVFCSPLEINRSRCYPAAGVSSKTLDDLEDPLCTLMISCTLQAICYLTNMLFWYNPYRTSYIDMMNAPSDWCHGRGYLSCFCGWHLRKWTPNERWHPWTICELSNKGGPSEILSQTERKSTTKEWKWPIFSLFRGSNSTP